jgi:hypothetical protein
MPSRRYIAELQLSQEFQLPPAAHFMGHAHLDGEAFTIRLEPWGPPENGKVMAWAAFLCDVDEKLSQEFDVTNGVRLIARCKVTPAKW